MSTTIDEAGQIIATPKAQTAVTITGLDIPFGDLVTLLIKVALAAVPAAMILTVGAFLLLFILRGVGGL